MKPQVPSILAKFFRKIDPATTQYEFRTADLPEIETLYRDNTTGIVWKVIAHSGEDQYVRDSGSQYRMSVSLSKYANQRERLVILQAVDHEGLTIHVEPDALKSKIHSSEHYAVAVKATPEVERFTKIDEIESDKLPFWKRGVTTMDTEKTLHTLLDPKTTSLYVLNVYPSKHGLPELTFEWSNAAGSATAKIEATWIPQDLLKSVPKGALLNNQTFLRFLDGGFIQPITYGSAKRIKETPEYQAEVERLNGIKGQILANYPKKAA